MLSDPAGLAVLSGALRWFRRLLSHSSVQQAKCLRRRSALQGAWVSGVANNKMDARNFLNEDRRVWGREDNRTNPQLVDIVDVAEDSVLCQRKTKTLG